MRVALAQLNPTVGNLSGNVGLVRAAVERARADAADLLVTPELVVSGYPPKDLLLREGFVAACDRAVERLAAELPAGLGVLIGHPTEWGVPAQRIGNAVSLLCDGEVRATVLKTLLPNYDVFDEQRYFWATNEARTIEFRGLRLGVHICEDAWWGEPDTFYHHEPEEWPNPVLQLADDDAHVLINLSASPFELNKRDRRRRIMQRHAAMHNLPLVFVNQVGGNDDLVFDGNSFVMDGRGEVVTSLQGFATDQRTVDLSNLPRPIESAAPSREEVLLNALTLGLADYIAMRLHRLCAGALGGIDSALAACIAARALGPDKVHGIMMPSRYSSDHSVGDAQRLAERLGIDWQIIPIDDVHRSYEGLPVLRQDLASQPTGLADQNLQARIRGAIVMTRSNRHGWIALATGNKSELAVGYCTLYGDMCGGFAVLSDLLKRDVYALSRYINEEAGREIIPVNTIEKAPSAELAPNQFDQDSLPPYPILDEILAALIEREESAESLYDRFPRDVVQWVVRALDRNEFKRRQMAPGIKLSARAFGSGRRMPMAARIQYE
ncbi:MAG: NAD+ synthase [Planctomycetaceae bacterium]